jgi:hypothetical protein
MYYNTPIKPIGVKMKTINKSIKPIIDIAPALSLYVSKGWINRFETQLEKLEWKHFSSYKFNDEFAEFRYDGYYYAIFDDRIRYRSLKEAKFHEIRSKDYTQINYA